MRKRILIVAASVIALCTMMISAGMIGRSVPKRDPVLLGLHGVRVEIVFQGPEELRKYSSNLTQQHLRATVESILRQRHIRGFPRTNSLP